MSKIKSQISAIYFPVIVLANAIYGCEILLVVLSFILGLFKLSYMIGKKNLVGNVQCKNIL